MSYRLTNRVIVTGADGCGKSTLVRQLTEDENGPKLEPYLGHDGGPPLTAEEVWGRLNALAACEVGIKDRCVAVDEPVYAVALKRKTPVSYKILDEWLKAIKPIIIFCWVDPDQVKISEEEKGHKDKELLAKVKANRMTVSLVYMDRVSQLHEQGVLVVPYNYTKDSLEDLLGLLELLGGVVHESRVH